MLFKVLMDRRYSMILGVWEMYHYMQAHAGGIVKVIIKLNDRYFFFPLSFLNGIYELGLIIYINFSISLISYSIWSINSSSVPGEQSLDLLLFFSQIFEIQFC